MSPPIYTPDGSEVSEIVLPDGSTASQVIGPDGNVVFEAGPDIPDSVVSRPTDNKNGSNSNKDGVRIETDVEWPEIDGKISANTSGATRAYIYRVSDGVLMGDTDISSLSAGDVFTINLDTNLVSGETYNFVLDAEGSSWTLGYYDSPSFPYTSDDGNLSIVNGAKDETGTSPTANAIVELGNL